MNKLEIVLDSREVAAMVDKEHSKLLRDIRTYIEQMDEANKKAFEEEGISYRYDIMGRSESHPSYW